MQRYKEFQKLVTAQQNVNKFEQLNKKYIFDFKM